MKKVIFLILLISFTGVSAQQKDYPFTPLTFTSVQLTDNFWLPRIKVNHTLPFLLLLNVVSELVG